MARWTSVGSRWGRRRSQLELVDAARCGDAQALLMLIESCEQAIAAGIRSGGLTPGDSEYADAESEALTTI